MIDDLKWIKKHYSEKMMHLCRDNFSTILETPGLLTKILSENFHNHKSLADDIINEEKEYHFRNYIYSKADIKREVVETDKNPFELMREAGYTLYKCETVEDMSQFVKYYTSKELLCTFHEIHTRLTNYDVFFAVKDNAENIKRSENPRRQDEYGTSVIGIQFGKGNYNNISIKNRYNHTVNNPDATFLNDLDNIIPGLSNSFEKYYGYLIITGIYDCNFKLDDYVGGPDNKFYKVNVSLNGVYYCADNITIVDDKIQKYDKEKYILIENYLLDLVGKKVTNLSKSSIKKDTFEKIFKDIKNIKIEKKQDEKIIKITNSKGETNEIIINIDNEFKSITLPFVESIDDEFLFNNLNLQSINLPNVKTVGDKFLRYNTKLYNLELPIVEHIGDDFLYFNKSMRNIYMPKLISIKDDFFLHNRQFDLVYLPELYIVGDGFLYFNKFLKNIFIPNLKHIGNEFLSSNEDLESINIPNAETIGVSFLSQNEEITTLILPNVKKIETDFLNLNKKITLLDAPKLKSVGSNFLYHNKMLSYLDLPSLQSIGNNCLYANNNITIIDIPNIEHIGRNFLYNNPDVVEHNQNKLVKKIKR